MAAHNSVEMMKEQLRAQTRELKKRDAQKAKNDAKIKHVLEVSKKKITDLKTEVAEKEQQILVVQKESSRLGFKKEDKAESAEESKPAEPSAPPPKPIVEKVVETVVETKEVMVNDPKLVKALNKLKSKYKELNERVEVEKLEKNQMAKERKLLTEEVKRLREQPDQMATIKEKVQKMDERSKQTQERYEKLLSEKNELIESYEKTIFDAAGGKNKATKLPSEIIKDLKDELQELRRERDRLESEMMEEKRKFDSKLEEEIKRIEDELGEKIRKLRKDRDKLGRFAGEVMEDEGAPLWMVTYSDMVTLLLTFFILYYSIASVNMQKFKEAILGEESASIGLLELLDTTEITESIQKLTGMKSDDILSEVSEVAEDTTMDVDTSKAKVVVRVPGATLFTPGTADLQKDSRPVLDEVIRVIKKYPDYKIHIQGHTDDSPIHTERFPTNWELSAARATAVLRYFIDKGIEPEKLTATGYADTFPLASNNVEVGRAKNRRVEFVLEKEK